jgi:hypothetical protein
MQNRSTTPLRVSLSTQPMFVKQLIPTDEKGQERRTSDKIRAIGLRESAI